MIFEGLFFLFCIFYLLSCKYVTAKDNLLFGVFFFFNERIWTGFSITGRIRQSTDISSALCCWLVFNSFINKALSISSWFCVLLQFLFVLQLSFLHFLYFCKRRIFSFEQNFCRCFVVNLIYMLGSIGTLHFFLV